MRTNIKKSFIIIAALLVTLSVSFGVIKAVNTSKCGDEAYFEVVDKKLIIKGTGSMYDTTQGEQVYAEYLEEVTEIVVSEGITYIGNHAFDTGYSGLQTNSKVKKVTLPSTLTVIGDYAFRGLCELEEIEFHEGLTSIGVEAFYGCNSLEKAYLPDSLTTLGAKAFKYCTSLNTIVFGCHITEIKDDTFYFDHDLKTIKFKDKTPPTFGSSVFNWSGMKFYVPKGTKAAYAAALSKNENVINEYDTYTVTVSIKNGSHGNTTVVNKYTFEKEISSNVYTFEKDDKIKIKAIPEIDYATGKDRLGDYKVKTATYTVNGVTNNMTLDAEGYYSFDMPNANVTVNIEYTATDERLFNLYRNEYAAAIKLYEGYEDHYFTPSNAVKAIYDEYSAKIKALDYNTLDKTIKSLADKKAEVDKLYNLAVNKAEFQHHKEVLEADDKIKIISNPADSNATKQIRKDALDKLHALNYDETKTLEKNNEAADDIMKYVADKMNFQRYKETKIKALENEGKTDDSNATKTILSNGDTALKNINFNESKTLQENKKLLDDCFDEYSLKANKQRFNDHRDSLKTLLDSYLLESDSAVTKKIVSDCKAELDAVNYDTTKTLSQNNTVLDEIIKNIPTDLNKQRFEEYRTELLNEVDGYIQTKDSAATKKYATDAKSELSAVKYDESKTLAQNKAILDSKIKGVAEKMQLQRDKEAFEKYKTELKENLDKVTYTTDSAVTKKFATDAKSALDNLKYDESKTLAQNKAAADAIVKGVPEKMQLQRDKEAFVAHRLALIESLDKVTYTTDSAATKKYATDAKSALENLKYDESKTLAQNKAAQDAIVKGVPEKMQLQRDKEAFDAYKTTLKLNLDKVTYTTDSAVTKKYATDAKSALDNLKYDETKTLAQNKAAADAIVKGVPEKMQLQRDKEAFEKHKTELKDNLDKVTYTTDSAATKKYATDAKSALDNLKYDESKTLAQNKAAQDAIVKGVPEKMQLQRDKEAFEAYRTTLKNNVTSEKRSTDSEATKKIADDALTALLAVTYDESKTLAQNKAILDSKVAGIPEKMQLQRDKEAFDIHKSELKDLIDSYCLTHDSAKTLKIAQDAKEALDNLAYDESLTLTRNNEIADEIWQPVEDAMQLQRNLEAFDNHKSEGKQTLTEDQLATDSAAVKKIFQDAKRAIDNLKYNNNITLDNNNLKIDEIVNNALQKVEKQRKLDEFNDNKEDKLQKLDEFKDANDSQIVRDLFEEYVLEINDTQYDDTKSLEDNKKIINDLYEEALKAIKLQRDKDEFDRYKNDKQRIVEENKVGKNIPEETLKTLNNLQKQINEYVYDESLTLQENKDAIDALFNQMIDILKDIPVMLEGDKEEYVTQSDEKDVKFRSSAPIDQFIEVRINGEIVDPSNYDVYEGSTIVTLHQDFVDKLLPGTYELDIVSTSGTASGEFIITDMPKQFPWTTVLYTGVPVLLIALMIAIFTKKKKEEIKPEEQSIENA